MEFSLIGGLPESNGNFCANIRPRVVSARSVSPPKRAVTTAIALALDRWVFCYGLEPYGSRSITLTSNRQPYKGICRRQKLRQSTTAPCNHKSDVRGKIQMLNLRAQGSHLFKGQVERDKGKNFSLHLWLFSLKQLSTMATKMSDRSRCRTNLCRLKRLFYPDELCARIGAGSWN